MEKKVTICGKEYNLKSSAYCILEYKRVFGKGLMADINSLSAISQKIELTRKVGKEANKSEEEINIDIETIAMAEIDNLVQIPLQVAYILIKSSNPTFMSFDEWLKTLDEIDIEDAWISEVTELAVKSFRR